MINDKALADAQLLTLTYSRRAQVEGSGSGFRFQVCFRVRTVMIYEDTTEDFRLTSLVSITNLSCSTVLSAIRLRGLCFGQLRLQFHNTASRATPMPKNKAN